ncbi:MAG: symmetrical bis(5'-nucleosyl)-tetraphosphatase [Nitrosomonas sp.]|uniref:symmetrical bis(5'-nucleosyl)-tetraphosphatase n=1 Tax=Nitrosomonas sp. TaxID=42353 RepID=UPI0025647D85|nr:symmetrical bis(5'-nucleosyl)-tetraphosphatase [Nitrosomonas sp.]MCC6161714.1 symmetrical bis(5'-nucleosyl)-tetraphosphatase [Nitrosomonas sp.]MDL1866972.1 symmetrical bis(5'-nucleosyl)-tetraphosphatase [Betaproteobacteria bacterium PRO4]
MATYAIGDLQGCHSHFLELLDLIGFNPTRDRLWLVGDIVNRGPDSLALLRSLITLGKCVTVVLGNHDLHLLAVAAGATHQHRGDTLQPVLEAPDSGILLDWLRQRPLFYHEDEYTLVHAGLLPDWHIEQAGQLAQEVETVIRSDRFQSFSRTMYGNTPDRWQDQLQGEDRWRVIINAMTRLRVCSVEGRLNFSYKGGLSAIPQGLLPWFEIPWRSSQNTTIVFGHWSALGLHLTSNLIALDTGCVWQGCLTSVRLEDRKVFQLPCEQH